MKEYSPGASIQDDYAYYCDNCQMKHSKKLLIWRELPDRKGHFAICLDCLRDLYITHIQKMDKSSENIKVKRRAISEKLREKVFKRDGYKCVNCNDGFPLVVDHKIPFSAGGSTSIDNLQTLCARCNSEKGDRLNG